MSVRHFDRQKEQNNTKIGSIRILAPYIQQLLCIFLSCIRIFAEKVQCADFGSGERESLETPFSILINLVSLD
jgi:hypothetical protein